MAAPRARAVSPDDERDAMISTLTRVLNRLIVNSSFGPGPASFRQIATAQLRVATDAEIDLIEAWIKAHP
jgi:hypothetical protein